MLCNGKQESSKRQMRDMQPILQQRPELKGQTALHIPFMAVETTWTTAHEVNCALTNTGAHSKKTAQCVTVF